MYYKYFVIFVIYLGVAVGAGVNVGSCDISIGIGGNPILYILYNIFYVVYYKFYVIFLCYVFYYFSASWLELLAALVLVSSAPLVSAT